MHSYTSKISVKGSGTTQDTDELITPYGVMLKEKPLSLYPLPNDRRSRSQVHGKFQVTLVNGKSNKISHSVCLVSIVENESVHGIRLEDNFQLQPRQNSTQAQSAVFEIRRTIKRRNLLLEMKERQGKKRKKKNHLFSL